MRRAWMTATAAVLLAAVFAGCDVYSDDDTTENYYTDAEGNVLIITVDGTGNTTSVVRADGAVAE